MKRFVMLAIFNSILFTSILLQYDLEQLVSVPMALVAAVISLLLLLWILYRCFASHSAVFSKAHYGLLFVNLVSGLTLVWMITVEPPYAPGFYICIYNIFLMLLSNMLRYEMITQIKKGLACKIILSVVWIAELSVIVLHRVYNRMSSQFSLSTVLLPMFVLIILAGAVASTAMCDTTIRFTIKIVFLALLSLFLLCDMDQGQFSVSVSYSWLWAMLLLPIVGACYSFTIKTDLRT